jgi:hypothetical protein
VQTRGVSLAWEVRLAARLLLVVVVILGGNLGIIARDRNRRRAQGLRTPDPGVSDMATFLPYYFAKTRGGLKGAALGTILLVGLMVLALVASAKVSLLIAVLT